MYRRQALVLLGSAALGGCLDGLSGNPKSTTRMTTKPDPTTTIIGTATDETVTETTTPDETEPETTPEPPNLGKPLPSECPVEDENVQRVVCDSVSDAPMAITSSANGVSLPTGSISFTLANDTDATFETNYYGWSLHKRVDGDWLYVAPGTVPLPAYRLSPGESHTWNVTVDNSNLGEEIVTVNDTADLQLRGLGGGTYAFGIDGWFVGQDYTDATAFVTRFEVEGDRLSLSLTDSVTNVEREDGMVAVEMPETENPRQVTVTRVDNPPEQPEFVVAEQVIRTTPLRNALAVFEEEGSAIRSVRVENATLMANFTLSLDENYVEYRGTTYRIERKRQETAD